MTETLDIVHEYFSNYYTKVYSSHIYEDSDIRIHYYNGIELEDTFFIDDFIYENLNHLSFPEKELIFNVVEYIKLKPEIFFTSQVEKIILIFNKKPLLIFKNNDYVCERAVVIDVDKIMETDFDEIKFLKKININYTKWLTLFLGISLIGTLTYFKLKK